MTWGKTMGRLVSINEIENIIIYEKSKGKTISFTNGCFDLFHYGHMKTFLEAKKLSDVLIVGVNSNRSIRILKGEKRPIIDEIYRAELIANLNCVDYVVIFDDESPIKLIEIIKPSIYLKGSDWKEKILPEEDAVKMNNGEIHYVDIVSGLSSSYIIKKILEVYGNE